MLAPTVGALALELILLCTEMYTEMYSRLCTEMVPPMKVSALELVSTLVWDMA